MTELKDMTVQDIQLELIRRAEGRFNCKAVVKSLIEHKELWSGVLLKMVGGNSLIPLRDLHLNLWNADTMYIIPKVKGKAKITKMVSTWGADDVCWIEGERAEKLLGHYDAKNPTRIVALWWD